MTTNEQKPYGSSRPLVIGFLLSIVLTLVSYFLVENQLLPSGQLLWIVLSLGLIQLVVQLIFFLHLSQEKAPRYQLIFFVSTVSIILLVVLGSMWIMHHLNYTMMPEHMEEFIIHDEGVKLDKQE